MTIGDRKTGPLMWSAQSPQQLNGLAHVIENLGGRKDQTGVGIAKESADSDEKYGRGGSAPVKRPGVERQKFAPGRKTDLFHREEIHAHGGNH